MRLISRLVLSFAAIAITACSSDAIEARRNEAEVMYRVPSYPPRYADNNDRVVYVQPSYRAIPSECDELIDSGNGYYYCDRD
jgi:hypothetical protein